MSPVTFWQNILRRKLSLWEGNRVEGRATIEQLQEYIVYYSLVVVQRNSFLLELQQ